MPDKQGARRDREDLLPPPTVHQPGEGGEPEPIGRLVADWTRKLPAQDRVLVPQHEQLGVLHHLAAQQGVGRLRKAEWVFQAALALATELGDPNLRAEVLANLGWVCVDLGGFAEAREHLLVASPLSIGVQGGRLEGFIEYNLSAAALGLGEHDEALRHAERSLALVQDAGDEDVASYAVHRLAQVRQSTDAHSEAIVLCERALAGESLRNDPRHRAAILDTLATSLRHLGNAPRAIECWQAALAIFERFGDDRAPALHTLLDNAAVGE